jgi:predicted  nucleic acid-binding Zn-ribbon protein
MSENLSELDPNAEDLNPITKHEAYLELLEKQLGDAQALPDNPTNQRLIKDLKKAITEAEYNRPTLPPSSC